MHKVTTYSEAGVDIDEEAKLVSTLIKNIKNKRVGTGAPLNISGHYAGLIEFGDYALVLCTDGVGSKVMIADEVKKWDTIGIDCIAMNVNDIICVGAEPLAFVDYLAIQKPDSKKAEQIGIGLNRGAELSNISIIGGETATLPDIIKGFDLAGTCLGYVKKDRIITGEKIKVGDVIIGLKSSGIHSNGLSLARKVFKSNGYSYNDKLPYSDRDITIGEVLLEPTKIYVKEILKIINKFEIHGLAHITGGGWKNIERLKGDVAFNLTNPLEPHEIFKVIQKVGKIKDEEMQRTFNMGMGFAIVVDSEIAERVVLSFKEDGVKARIVGEVTCTH